jgi:hypothetical protein
MVILAAIIVSTGPPERTLGPSIRFVYVHVALSWVGLTGFGLAALLSLPRLAGWGARVARLAEPVAEVALWAFALSVVSSMVAAVGTWGGVFWDEPRLAAVLQVLAVAVIARVLRAWLPGGRWRAVLHVVLAAWILMYLPTTPLVLHPRNAITTSSSIGIQATFASLYAIGLALSAWCVGWLWARSARRVSEEARYAITRQARDRAGR